ncbi:MlaD family protein [Proteiniphilum sp.]|uniref:MlaD family protein n=1 Tax=Proteiniphilum sp. TaxID=1926877 RepID=UPI002B1EAF59|nr:MlaD family protein [Proteiniphilum sp.]MEA4917034.1 MlaD family protein [Proteiniphilum sp.]
MGPKLSRNALIGLAFIASLVMIYFGINFLKGVNVFKKQNQYYAQFDDVSKLLISSPIYVKGYQIGLINKIEMVSDDPMRFSVGLNLSEDIRIPEGSYLEYDLDMFGASTVNLVMGSSNVYVELGDTITGKKMFGLMDGVATVMPKADSILLRVDSLIYTLHKIVANPAWDQSIKGIGNTVEQLSRSSVSLNRMVSSMEKDLPEISKNLASVSSDLKVVSNELSQMDMATTFASIDETVNNLKQLTAKINSDDNSLGLLLNDTKLHDSLNMTIDTATKLLEDIRQNPDRYLTIRVKLF